MNILAWLKKLISFNTISAFSNLELIHFVANYLESCKISVHLSYNPEKTKANILATIAGSSEKSGLLLSGHTDVVPVTGQLWEADPFVAQEKSGRIYGRGSTDMKGFIAVLLSILPQLQAMKLSRPIHLALSFDEEVGCHGAPLIIADMKRLGIIPMGCIVGEPSKMMPILGHKGIQGLRCHLKGVAQHSSLTPEGCNAIEYGAQLIVFLRDLADEMRREGPYDENFDIPFSTLSTNLIKGGIALNTIPDECEILFEYRHLPKVAKDKIFNRIKEFTNNLQVKMKAEKKEASLTLKSIAYVPGLESSLTSLVYQLAKKITKCDEIKKIAYATEGGLFQEMGIPTIICGPGGIEEAHCANEYIEISQLQLCEKFLLDMVYLSDKVNSV